MRGVDSSMAALRRDIRSKAGCCVALGWAAGMAAVGIDCGRRRGLLAACLLACFVLRHVYRDLTWPSRRDSLRHPGQQWPGAPHRRAQMQAAALRAAAGMAAAEWRRDMRSTFPAAALPLGRDRRSAEPLA